MVSLETGDDLDSFQRRSMGLMKFPRHMSYETYQQLSDILEDVDNSAILTGGAHAGPFRCFRLVGAKMEASDVSRDKRSPLDEETQSPEPPTHAKKAAHTFNEGEIFIKMSNEHVHYKLTHFAKLSIHAIKGPDYHLTEQNMMHILYPKFFLNIDSDDDWLANAKLVNNKLYSKCGDSLVLHDLMRELLSNFSSHLISITRLGLEHDYIEVLLIPFVKSIVAKFVCWDFASWDVVGLQDSTELDEEELICSIKLCIMYLTLGLSAFHLSRESESVAVSVSPRAAVSYDEYLRISMELRKLSIKLLTYHLDESDVIYENQKSRKRNGYYDSYLLLALILQIELDSMFSVFENFDLIYAIGDFVIKTKLKAHERKEVINKLFINIFKLKYFMYESTQAVNKDNYQIDAMKAEIDYADLKDDYDLVDSQSDEEEEEEDDGDNGDDDDTNLYTNAAGKVISPIRPTISNMVSANTMNSAKYVPTAYTISFDRNKDYGAAYEVTAESALAPSSNYKFTPHLDTEFTTAFDADLIYLMYGIPRDLLHIYHESIHLANHKSIFNIQKVFPRNFPRIVADLEDRLLTWDHSKSNWHLDPKNPFHDILIKYVKSFHQAVILYHRKLMNKNFRAEEYQYLVDSSLDCLVGAIESAKALKLKFKPMFWNLFICGSLALGAPRQARVQQIWSGHGFRGQANYWRAKQILFEIWNRRDNGEEEDNVGFMNLIREWDIHLSLG
ncbi:uncharacterized protein LODBEIA_P48380 [Lodderomyces beijingensis]|uniref:Arginine metabolism regulation protein II n=1 Tax=Lodderomyces beijingensis TaxID=1775926 RepID=A0ABP0ZR53_9ASCO